MNAHVYARIRVNALEYMIMRLTSQISSKSSSEPSSSSSSSSEEESPWDQADKTYDEINLLGTSSEMRKFTEKLAKSRSLMAGKVSEYYAVFDISDPLDDSKAKKLYAMFQRHFNVA